VSSFRKNELTIKKLPALDSNQEQPDPKSGVLPLHQPAIILFYDI
jgi:hypothetical protein